MSVNVGVGVAGIAGVGTGAKGSRSQIGSSIGKALGSAYVWAWIIFVLCVAWLLGLFVIFGGYRGDVAS